MSSPGRLPPLLIAPPETTAEPPVPGAPPTSEVLSLPCPPVPCTTPASAPALLLLPPPDDPPPQPHAVLSTIPVISKPLPNRVTPNILLPSEANRLLWRFTANLRRLASSAARVKALTQPARNYIMADIGFVHSGPSHRGVERHNILDFRRDNSFLGCFRGFHIPSPV